VYDACAGLLGSEIHLRVEEQRLPSENRVIAIARDFGMHTCRYTTNGATPSGRRRIEVCRKGLCKVVEAEARSS
jgi:hypothetical protein